MRVAEALSYLVVGDEGLEDLERDDVQKDVSIGADCIDWGVLPCLEPIAIEQVVGLHTHTNYVSDKLFSQS